MKTRRATTSTTRSRSPSELPSYLPAAVHLRAWLSAGSLAPVSFAPPGKKDHATNDNISLVMKFFLGMHDLLHVPVPIWVAVESVVGTVRLRCQMVAKPPYIRNVTFTLMGVPAINAVSLPGACLTS